MAIWNNFVEIIIFLSFIFFAIIFEWPLKIIIFFNEFTFIVLRQSCGNSNLKQLCQKHNFSISFTFHIAIYERYFKIICIIRIFFNFFFRLAKTKPGFCLKQQQAIFRNNKAIHKLLCFNEVVQVHTRRKMSLLLLLLSKYIIYKRFPSTNISLLISDIDWKFSYELLKIPFQTSMQEFSESFSGITQQKCRGNSLLISLNSRISCFF